MVEQTLTPMDPLPPISTTTTTSYIEIRLFYIRIASSSTLPPRLLLTHHSNSTIQINGLPFSSSSASLPLRLDRLDRPSGEATYVSTDSVRLSDSDFEVATLDDDDRHPVLLLRGKFELMDSSAATDEWAMSCCAAADAPAGSVVEMYVAGSYKGSPVILTRTVKMSSKRNGWLDAAFPSVADDADEDETDMKLGPKYCPEGQYSEDDDGQLSWFNAGVRVGVGIGLGMCVGLGIGVGLLMRSYQATSKSFKRRFL